MDLLYSFIFDCGNFILKSKGDKMKWLRKIEQEKNYFN